MPLATTRLSTHLNGVHVTSEVTNPAFELQEDVTSAADNEVDKNIRKGLLYYQLHLKIPID